MQLSIFFLINALVYVNIDQGIHKDKSKIAWNDKWKTSWVFYTWNIIANFEVFHWKISLSTNLLFLKSGHLGTYIENTSRDDPLVEVTRGQIE